MMIKTDVALPMVHVGYFPKVSEPVNFSAGLKLAPPCPLLQLDMNPLQGMAVFTCTVPEVATDQTC
jgi:hypothetical protein